MVAPGRWAPDALIVSEGRALRRRRGRRRLRRSDEASQPSRFSPAGSRASRPRRLRSPGGKTAAMAAAMKTPGSSSPAMCACARRVAHTTIAASGATNIRVIQADVAAAAVPWTFDCVLVDAPCSGLGAARSESGGGDTNPICPPGRRARACSATPPPA
jgi:hypothetical protein